MKFRDDLLDLRVEIVRAVLRRHFAGHAIDASELRQQLADGAPMRAVYQAASNRLSYRPPLHTPVFTDDAPTRFGERLWAAVDWVGRLFGFRRNVQPQPDLIDRDAAPHVRAAAGDAARPTYPSQGTHPIDLMEHTRFSNSEMPSAKRACLRQSEPPSSSL